MDLTLFHPLNPDGAPRNFHIKDKLNGWTKRRSCRFLEWTGWYNYSLAQRLLGHYRLSQHFSARYAKQAWEYSAVQAYLLQYRGTHAVKYSIFRMLGFVYSIGTRKEYYSVAQVAAVNHILVNEGTGILQEFLTAADTDFAAALTKALEKINDPAFFDNTAFKAVNTSVTQNNQFNRQSNHFYTQTNHFNTQNNQFNNKNEVTLHQFNLQPVIKDGAKGKEKGVFSKRQMLIFFDLLSVLGRMEKIDFKKTSRYALLATLFHAITGRSKESIIEELYDYRHKKDLYECKGDGEIDQLVIVLTNLAAPFRDAGFEAFAKLVDQKIDALRQQKKK